MFKNVGKEIKNWASVYIMLMMIPAVILSLFLVVWFTFEWKAAGFLLSFIPSCMYLIVTFILARRSTMEMYAFGEITENVAQIREYIIANSVQGNAKAASSAVAQHEIPADTAIR